MLPIAILISFIVMQLQGINANIMSLGGIAVAIGTMVDAAIIMIENAHRHIEQVRSPIRGHRLQAGRSRCRGRRCLGGLA